MISLLTIVAFAGPLKGIQSVLNPVGPGAERAADLWMTILWICIIVFVLVWIVLLRSFKQIRGTDAPPPVLEDVEEADRRAKPWVIGAVAVTVLTLFGVLVAGTVTSRRVTKAFESKNPITIQVIGHQWWWEVRYPNSDASKTIITANEIHLPVGVPIVMNTASRDVIHSFWAPNIHGKRDLIPGYSSAFWFQIDHPGVYRGQCAEFCGFQHAKMAFYIVAEPVEKFQQWQADQLVSARAPDDELKERGMHVFQQNSCVLCHTIRGTVAGSKVGPDLTHLASRGWLAAATIPNNPGNLGAWITDSQHIKPGNYMPPNPLSGPDLTALLAYLSSLQ